MPHCGILNDREIIELCTGEDAMLDPFIDHQEGAPSYGLSSFGYDLRLGEVFILHRSHRASVIDPLDIDKVLFKTVVTAGTVFNLQPHSQVLAESVERFIMPDDVMGEVKGKSSYARCGLLVNTTVLEPGWRGVLTIELANLSDLPIVLHIGQGIGQAVFQRGNSPLMTYDQKKCARYQDQTGAQLPK